MNPFEDLKESKKPDRKVEVEIVRDELVDAVVEGFSLFGRFDGDVNSFDKVKSFKDSKKESLESKVLNPIQFDTVLKRLICKCGSSDYWNDLSNKNMNITLSLYLTLLLENSYKNGHNNFVLSTGETKLNYLLIGSEFDDENPLIISEIKGNVGDEFAWSATKVSVGEIKGSVGDWFAYGATKVSVGKIKGSVGYGFARNAREVSVGEIKGSVGNWFAYGATNSTFKTYKPELYEKLLKIVPNQVGEDCNKVILLKKMKVK